MDDDQIDIHYIKSGAFREIACDGVMGGPTPSGKIWIGFYTQRFPVPRVTRHKIRVDETGSLDVEPIGDFVEGRQGIVRNVEFGVYVSREEAGDLAKFLTDSLADTEDREENKEK